LPLLVFFEGVARLQVFDPKNNFMDVLVIPRKRTPDVLNDTALLRINDFQLQFPELLSSPRSMWGFLGHASSTMTFWDRLYFLSATRRLDSSHVGAYHPNVAGVRHSDQNAMVDSLIEKLMSNTEGGDSTAIAPQASRITVKVWNASDQQGLAYNVTRFLRLKGFDVVDRDNRGTLEPQTRVIDRKGNIRNARDVAQALGVETFVSEPNPNALVDVDVVIGQNFNGKLTERR
jgi:hypothetical protein